MKKDYLISYTLYDKQQNIIKSGKIKVKNKLNEMDAKVKLDVYLKSKNKKADNLVIHSCNESSIFSDIFEDFDSNIFGKF